MFSWLTYVTVINQGLESRWNLRVILNQLLSLKVLQLILYAAFFDEPTMF